MIHISIGNIFDIIHGDRPPHYVSNNIPNEVLYFFKAFVCELHKCLP